MLATIKWGSNEEFINNYLQIKSSEKMAKIYNCSKTSVLKHAKDIGFDPKSIDRKCKLSEQDKKEIREAYYSEKTSTELAKQYKVSRGMITKIWYDAGLKGKKTKHLLKLDLSGKQVNDLTVLYATQERDSSGSVLWACQCKCGKIVNVSSTRLNSGAAKSCGCASLEKFIERNKARYKDLTGQKFGKLTVIKRVENKESSNGKSFIQFLCECECGRKTTVMSENLQSGNTKSCGLCKNNSHGNIKIEELLIQNKIPFVREKRFETCKDKTMLPFDFFIDNKYLIEYDGVQHFLKESDFFDCESIQKHDKIKNQWCKDNKIPLIRIPYTHCDNLSIKDLLLETSNFIIK